MEALQLLVEMVKDLPDMAIWVIIAFFVYKTIIVGSIYGLIKHVATKVHDAVVTKKRSVKTVELRPTIDGMCISGVSEHLIGQLTRIKNRSNPDRDYEYIFKSDVDWLREAIDEKINRENERRQGST